MRRIAVASSVGHTIELYDFLIYGTAAATVFNRLFFPQNDPLTGLLLAFATFGAGFAARPIGGMVIGHFGDRLGRRGMLVLTLVGTGLSTALIGLLPTYATIGAWAPALLVLLRVSQGFFLGGEAGGAVLLVAEHAPPGRRGWYGSWLFLGSPAGFFLATGLFSLSSAVSGAGFYDWGWRLPFLFSVVLVLVGLYLRLRVPESPEFEQAREKAASPLAEVFRTAPRQVLFGTGVNMGFQIFIFLLVAFAVSYVTTILKLSPSIALNASLMGATAQIITVPIAGRLADHWGRIPVMLSGAIGMALLSFPFFWLLDTAQPGAIYLASILGAGISGFLFGPMAAFYAELFPTRVRYTGIGVSYQLGAVLGGGFAPFVATALLKATGGESWPVSVYLLLGSVITIVSLLALREGRTTVRESPATVG
ncbi:MFS transporter [Pseudonocardiaceae bacterium YIM PH 21723]|nr:MFS transporter [Pseudonocardiaceae bacterium YIM PH 21723]